MEILDIIKSKVIVLDGAMGSMLIQAGLKSNEVPETWNLEKAELVQQIHQSYADAGADAILTNTFGGSPLKLLQKGIMNVEEITSSAVINADKTGKLVIGDIGPTGKMIKPLGDVTQAELYATFQLQAQYLIKNKVDAILIETMYDLREAIQAVKSVREISNSIPIFATITFEKKKKGFFTLMGDTPKKCFKELELAGADVVGANCTLSSSEMIELVTGFTNITTLPILIQPNAGQPIHTENGIEYPEDPEEYASNIMNLIDLGVRIVGGCCGTTPDHIAAIKRKLGEK